METFPEDLTLPAGMKYHELPTGDNPLVFWGQFIHEVDTDDGNRSRWTHLQLYKIIDTDPEHGESLSGFDENARMYGREMYLLYTIGHTLVYHDKDSSCRGGVKMPVSDFARKTADYPLSEDDPDLEPCEKCSPADYRQASKDDLFRLEITWYSYTPCQTADKLIQSLYREPRCAACRHKPHAAKCWTCGWCTTYREATRMLSAPGRELLEGVRDTDSDIAAAMGAKRRL
jgi:hypothetical protein